MAAKESYREKQENELEVLKSIFNQEDVIDLRPPHGGDKWYPLDLKIKLEPQRGSAFSQAYCHCYLRIKAPKNYPKVPPKLSIEDPKGLSNHDITKLLTQLNKEAYGLKGEVCIFELCQYVQAFLHERNQPPKGSFYDEMLAMKLKKDEEEKKVQAEKEQKWNQQYADEVTKRKEQLKKEQRTRRSTINDSPMRHLSSEGSNSECQMFDVCEEHKRSETLLIPLEGKKILQGACLGHSIKGCINYSGIDYSTGKLYYITEWTIRNSLLESRNLEVSDFIENVEKKVQMLMKLKHTNIVNYEGVVCNRRKDSVQVILIQEFILGISVCSMSGSCFNWNTESISSMTKGILEGLIFLHNNGVSHDNLTDSAVFLDSSGVIKISDYSVIPYLQEILNGIPFSLDLPSLGSLIESLIPTPHALEMRNFINECKSERTLSASSLLEHPFLYNIPISSEIQAQSETKAITSHPPPALQVATITPTTAVVSTHSRLKSEFEIIKEIGQGAYGKVLKVRNNLDNRFYAIKKIPLTGLNKQLYRKVRREVELLSRLNHENVVRYYSSWTEQEIDSIEEEDSDDEDDFDESTNRNYKSSLIKTPSRRDRINDDDIFDAGWNVYLSDSSSDSDDYDDDIEFVDSQGRAAQYEDDESGSDGGTGNNGNKPVAKRKEVLYIQMEFCEKLTLRSAIDNGLLGDKGRIWKLFREIVEGLTHLHQQGMIHRDLKCDNIFLDSKDHVKIGDFGLATTNILALQNQNAEASQALHLPKISYGDSQTGLVGTALYCAPELSQVASKSIYNQKVDLYSLGIIFFEMCMPKFQTAMERNQVLQDLRKPEIIFPEMMMDDEFKRERQVISWLLNHNPLARPTSEELLQSDLMPPAKVEASEIQEMFRHVLANPQSRNYKNLINRIMQQENDDIVNSAYHTNMYFISAVFENVKIIIEQIFRKHGALDVSTPLLTPYHKSDSDSLVRLMTHSGSIVTLPMDLRQTFLRMIAQNVQINWLRRYAIGRTYRERKAHNQHPKQTYECVFDIVTPIRGHSLVDAELMAIVHEIISNFEILKQRNICFKINHTSLVRAIFLYYSVPASVYKNILALIKDYYDNAKISKKQLTLSVISLLPARNRPTVNALIDTLLLTDVPISNLSSTNLKVIIKGRGDATTLAKGALRELETVISLTQAMGVAVPINICVSLTMGLDCSRGSIIWNVYGETKPGKSTIICYGGRFDYQLEDYQKSCHKLRELYCAGFTIAMDKLIACLNPSHEYHSAVDLVVFISGTRPPVKDVCQIMKSLWASNIKCCFIESQDDDDIAKSLGANHIIVLGEDGCIRIKSWQNDRYQEKSVSRGEAIDYLKKNLSADFYVGSQQDMNNLMRNNSVSSIANDISTTGLPSYDIVFIGNEKYNSSKRKRLENQIEQKFEKVLYKFSRKETFIIFAIELDGRQIRAFLSCIDPNSKDQSLSEFDAVLKSFPKNKQDHLQEVYDEITDRLCNNKSSIIYGIFGIPDSYCRLIL